MATTSNTELAILNGAQAFVDDWRLDRTRGPFLRAVRLAASAWAMAAGYQPAQRLAFIRVAQAIRVGRGHAESRPEPLLDIIRFSLLDYSNNSK